MQCQRAAWKMHKVICNETVKDSQEEGAVGCDALLNNREFDGL
jgi:hypothetical protein